MQDKREGGREVGGASRPRPTVPDVRLSPCPIMLDNCTAHSRLRPCPLDIKVQRLAGRWALRSFELVLYTAVTQAPAQTTHTSTHISSDLHKPREALSGLQVPQAKGHDSQPHVVADWQMVGLEVEAVVFVCLHKCLYYVQPLMSHI